MTGKFLLCVPLLFGTLYAQNNLTTTSTQRYFNTVRRSLEASADAMPAEKYGFRLTDGQMTFAEWLIHSAQRNYADCATLKAESAPEAAKQLDTLKDKAAVSKALKDSFAYCAAALETVDDQKVLSSPQMSNAFLHIVVHNNEIYGNVVGYLRASGIVPPSTAARSGQKK
jgi:DinB superfamily